MPHDIAAIMAQVEAALIRWQRQNKLGSIAIVCGANEFVVEERPVEKLPRVRRELQGSSILERVTEP